MILGQNQLIPNITDFVMAHLFLELEIRRNFKVDQNKIYESMANSLGGKQSIASLAINIDYKLPILSVWISNRTLDNIQVDNGFGIHLIIEEEFMRLGMKDLQVGLYKLRMAIKKIVERVGMFKTVEIHIHGIPYIITLIVIKNKEVNAATRFFVVD